MSNSRATNQTGTTKSKAKRAVPKLDHDKLLLLADKIAGFPNGMPEHEIAALERDHGLKKTEKPKGSGLLVLQMAGMKTRPAVSMHIALTNWANKARRAAAQHKAV